MKQVWEVPELQWLRCLDFPCCSVVGLQTLFCSVFLCTPTTKECGSVWFRS